VALDQVICTSVHLAVVAPRPLAAELKVAIVLIYVLVEVPIIELVLTACGVALKHDVVERLSDLCGNWLLLEFLLAVRAGAL